MGRSEERIGKVVRELGGWPEGRVLSTKLDRDPTTGRFDAGQARRSLEESLAALGVDRVDVLHLHDPEHAADLDEIIGEAARWPSSSGCARRGWPTRWGWRRGRSR